jgi:hypothetical protein
MSATPSRGAEDERPRDGDESDAEPSPDAADDAPQARRPLYPRLLHLRHVSPNGWQRALLGEGAVALACVLVLADVASAWTLLALPLGVALVVKAHDLLAGLLQDPGDDDGAAPEGAAPEVARPRAAEGAD